MPTIYISDSGDDKNDGLSLQTAIYVSGLCQCLGGLEGFGESRFQRFAGDPYSLKRAKEVRGGRNDFSWHFGPRAWKRIRKELADKKQKE